MNAHRLANWHLDTKKLGCSTSPAIASPATAPGPADAPAGKRCTWPSTTTRASASAILVDEKPPRLHLPAGRLRALGVASMHDRQRSGLPVPALRQAVATIAHPAHPPRPYTPRTNGKANASSRPSCASGPTPSSIDITTPNRELEPWMHHYNFHRPHSAVSHRPVSRLGFVAINAWKLQAVKRQEVISHESLQIAPPPILDGVDASCNGGSSSRAAVRECWLAVGPLTERRLDEAFSLAVGLRALGSREAMGDAELVADGPEVARAEGRAVVG